MAFQNHGIYAGGKRLRHQAVEVHIAGTQLHAVGFQNRRYGAARNAGAAVIDVPQLHAGSQTLHPRKRIRAALGEPVAVKLKVDELRVGFLQQNVVGTLFGVDMAQLAVVVVVQKLHALGLQRRARLVQPCGKVVHRGFIAVVKAIHTRDDNILRAKALGFVGHGLGVAFQTAQIGVQADDLQPRFFDQSVPVEVAALAHGHARRLGQQPHHKADGVDHKPAQLNAVIACGLHGSQCLARLVFVA